MACLGIEIYASDSVLITLAFTLPSFMEAHFWREVAT